MAILDEALLLFLTGERDARLGAFLRSSVPYGTLIPYTPRNVPPEIFYGREGAVQELQRKDGSCLIYGGRQMGKSALLRQVRRQAHNPSATNTLGWKMSRPLATVIPTKNPPESGRVFRDSFQIKAWSPSALPATIKSLLRLVAY